MFYRIMANEVLDPLSFWQEVGLCELRSIAVSVSYFRCVEFFKDTFSLKEMAAVVGKYSY